MYPGAAETALVALDLFGLALLAGLAAAWLWLAPRPPQAPAGLPRLGPLFGAALAALLAGGVSDLLMRTAALADLPVRESWPLVPRVLSGSDYGAFWILRTLVIVALALLFWIWRRRLPFPALPVGIATAVAAVSIAFTASATGHAGDDGSFSVLAMSNALHVTAGCLWGGMVLIYAFGIAPHMRGGRVPPAPVAESAVRLSTLAGLALAAVLATGIYNAWMLVGSVSALWTTDYGRVLLVKLLFVAAMMAAGFYNRFFAVPAVQAWARPPQLSPAADAPLGRLQQVLRGDALVFLFILICAATLGNTTPAAHL